MEDDFKIFSQEEINEINKYEIPYKWRDSCVDDLLNWKRCMKHYPYTKAAMCIVFQNSWQDCQFKREVSIIASENFTTAPEERRRLSY